MFLPVSSPPISAPKESLGSSSGSSAAFSASVLISINLSASDINTFSFFDLVYIKQRVFRVNRIDYKPKDLSTVELIMIP